MNEGRVHSELRHPNIASFHEMFLFGDLAVIANPATQWTCCWLSYTGPRGEPWSWQMCGGQMPGGLPYDPDGRRIHCDHWHHQFEIFMA